MLLYLSYPPHEIQLKTAPLELNIVYEDEDLLVINKAAGVTVHPGAGTNETTLVEGILHSGRKLYTPSDIKSPFPRPGVVHRIDKDTTGLIVLAKNKEAFEHLGNQFLNKNDINREYIALQEGVMSTEERVLESYLFRSPQKRISFESMPLDEYEKIKSQKASTLPSNCRWAKSIFKRKAVFGHKYTLVTVKLVTGRTHQIRVHSQHLATPILGDPIYNTKKTISSIFSQEVRDAIRNLDGQLLHAQRLGFMHPKLGKKIDLFTEPPTRFKEILDLLKPYETSL